MSIATSKFLVTQKRGIDDLKGLHAFVGSWGQGDHYNSNDCSVNHPSYVKFVFDCEKNQDSINKEIDCRKAWNKNYIDSLKANGLYGSEYKINVTFVTHPLFDENPQQTLMSSSFIFLNTNNEQI
jgi:hypothetical protein